MSVWFYQDYAAPILPIPSPVFVATVGAWMPPLERPLERSLFLESGWSYVWPLPAPPVPAPTTLTTGVRRLRRSPHLTSEQLWLFVERFQLELQVGVGLSTGQGSDPQIMLRISRNGGRTWGPELWTSAGKIGQYSRRALWRRLGRGRDLVFEVSVSDPVLWCMVEATMDISKGTS